MLMNQLVLESKKIMFLWCEDNFLKEGRKRKKEKKERKKERKKRKKERTFVL